MSIGPVMLDVLGTALCADDIARLQHPACGGVILFSRNYDNYAQLCTLVAAIRQSANKPLLIAVDHEGGRVQRFRDGFTHLPAMAWLGVVYDTDPERALDASRTLGWLMADELRACDIDISFAPVLDLDLGLCSVIGDRAFHADPAIVSALAIAWIEGMRQAGMASTGKHFPGHGGVSGDSHLELPVDNRIFDAIVAQDLTPFAALFAAGLNAVMPAHVLYRSCDMRPAGFSTFWLQQVLRQQMHFDGVIFSDDLSMEGAAEAGSYAERTHAALQAGCDMVLVCNQPSAADAVLAAIAEANLSPERQSDSQARLARMLGSQAAVPALADLRKRALAYAAEGLAWMSTRNQ
jgi:beta-N-acetylhexosaminidase